MPFVVSFCIYIDFRNPNVWIAGMLRYPIGRDEHLRMRVVRHCTLL